MNREIKFRGQRVDNNEWIEGDLVHDYWIKGNKFLKYAIRYKIGNLYSFPIEVIPDTIGQFTGHYSKDGKEIYEGDYDEDGNSVTFCQECNGWEFAGIDIKTKDIYLPCHNCDGNFMFEDIIEDIEVIGNIHQNNK